VTIAKPFWLGATEISNEQFRRFMPDFDARFYGKRHARDDDQGLPLNQSQQPTVRVSWQQAMAFCQWLSGKTGLEFTLPTEAQWEWACRAGSGTPFYYVNAG
jgi:formylglycine-generating enzyme required for sulfatase activity